MEVEIISKDCIRPSSPTPQHLRTYKLSLLDQFNPSVYTPMVLFYPIADDQSAIQKDGLAIEKKLNLLKESLSQTLSRFYPLARKIKDSLSIDCNDEGVYYVEARVKSNLSEFLNQPDLSLIKKCLPCDPTRNESVVGAHVAMVQTNVFDCGGITIGVFVTHMVADGIALSTFLRSWGATAMGSTCDGAAIISPDYTTAHSVFPQNDSFPKELSMIAMYSPFLKIDKMVTRRFVFDSSALATMKAKASSLLVQNPTRVEAVSALIWKCTMAAFKANSGGTQKPSLVAHAVNLRRRAGSPFSECTMGNLLGSAVAKCTAETEAGLEKETELCHLVHELRRAITKVNNGFLKTLEGDQGFTNFCEALREMGGVFSNAANSNKGGDFLGFTSWINFGLYEIDFGWGKPMWVTNAGSLGEEALVFLNFVFLMETKWGNGIEAWVQLDQQDMAILECNEELLAYASLNPSPLQSCNLESHT